MWDAVRRLHAGGTTVLLVTHDMAEAEALCDRIIVMRAGRVLDAGTPAELVARHARQATVCSACRTSQRRCWRRSAGLTACVKCGSPAPG